MHRNWNIKRVLQFRSIAHGWRGIKTLSANGFSTSKSSSKIETHCFFFFLSAAMELLPKLWPRADNRISHCSSILHCAAFQAKYIFSVWFVLVGCGDDAAAASVKWWIYVSNTHKTQWSQRIRSLGQCVLSAGCWKINCKLKDWTKIETQHCDWSLLLCFICERYQLHTHLHWLNYIWFDKID